MKNRPQGFTLIEVMVVVAIVAFLVALAVPSFNSMLMRRSVQGAAVALVTDIRYARSEALRRSVRVSICSLAAGSTDTCSGTTAAWVNGWIVFVDVDTGTGNVGTRQAATEEIVRVQQPLSNILSIENAVAANTKPVFTFQANGIAISVNDALVVKPTTAGSATNNRLVCISTTGRPSIRKEGDTTC